MPKRLALVVLLLLTGPVVAAPPPKVSGAADGIFEAFHNHPLVGIGEWHGLAQEQDFYAVLIRDPRFAAEVGNIVLETGSATQQETVDRYVNGENVPYLELRKVWADVVGWVPTVTSTGSVNLYAAIRAVNAALPPEKRIKVWLGEPPVEWSKINSKADWEPLLKVRETHAADLIKREILEKGRKALVIYGAGHLGVYPGYDNLRAQIASTRPDAWFVVMPYIGYFQARCGARFEPYLRKWPVPALASPVKGSSLGKRIVRPGCAPFDVSHVPPAALALSNPNNYGLTSDALLYLGPRAQLTKSPSMPDLYLDLDFRAELDRRNRIITGQALENLAVEQNPAVSRPWE